MTKLTSVDIDSFETYSNVIKKQHKDMLEARASYIRAMYKILRENGYTRVGAINTIYVKLAEKLDSLIEVRKTFIEKVTEKMK